MDLPGLIQSVDKKEDERYIHLVEGLVKEYLQSDKTVILQCFQSDEDIEVRTISLNYRAPLSGVGVASIAPPAYNKEFSFHSYIFRPTEPEDPHVGTRSGS